MIDWSRALLLDIETAPQGWREVRSTSRPPEAIIELTAHRLTQRWRQTAKKSTDAEILSEALNHWKAGSLDSRRGETVMVGLAGLDVSTALVKMADTERELLRWLAGELIVRRPSAVIAYGGARFDFPWLWERGVLACVPELSWHFVRALPYQARRAAGMSGTEGVRLVDPLELWTTTARKRDPVTGFGPMKAKVLAAALGLPDEDPIEGGGAILDTLMAGEDELAKDHCHADLVRLRGIVRALRPTLDPIAPF